MGLVKWAYLCLPRNGDGAGIELGVEGVIRGIQIDSFHSRKLLDIQNVLGVYSMGLGRERIEVKLIWRNGQSAQQSLSFHSRQEQKEDRLDQLRLFSN